LIYPNNQDPNNPKVRIVPAGEGVKIVNVDRIEAQKEEDNARLFGLILPLGWMVFSYISWIMHWISDVIYAATLIVGVFLLIGFNLGSQFRTRETVRTPKLLVDNSGKKTAPFFEGTGARAGALLGDVRHDPLQCFYGFNVLYLQKEGQNGLEFEKKPFAELWGEMFEKYHKEVIRNEKGYEAIMLPPDEKIFTLGYEGGKPVLSRILSLNKQPFEGELIELTVGNKTVALTPEHKVDTSNGYKEAGKISKKDNLITLVKVELAKIFN